MTTCPIAHAFEFDAQRGRITGIRFRMDDGGEVVVGARTAIVEKPEHESADEWRAEVAAC